MSKTASGLIEYAKAQVGKPYWFGTYGQTASQSLYNQMKKQYPSYYTATDFTSQYGQRVHDCSGLIKGYLWSDTPTSTPTYSTAQDKTASAMYITASNKGKISTIPKEDGVLVFKGTYASSITHVGIYCYSDGYVYEAKGHAYGVKKTKFSSSDWNFWAKHPDIDYSNTTSVEVTDEDEDTLSLTAVTSTKTADYKSDEYYGKYIVTASSLNMRNDAGKKSGNKILATFPKGTVVNCYGYYSKYNSEIWLYVTLTYNGTQYTGFMSLEYLAKG